MAVSWLDGFDSGDLTSRYTTSSCASSSGIGGRAGKQARLTTASGSIATSFSNRTAVSFGMRIHVVAGSDMTLVDPGASFHPNLRVNSAQNGLEVEHRTGGMSSTVFAAGAIARNTWTYVEMAYLYDSGAGYVTVRINGAVTYSYTGDTTYLGTGSANVASWKATTNQANADLHLDDLYIGDGQLLGPVTIACLVPTSDKSATWTPSVAGAHYPLVAGTDPATAMNDYVSAAAGSALVETYGLTPPGSMGDVSAIQVNAFGMASDGGSSPVTLFADGQAGPVTALGATAALVSAVFPTASGSAPWTGAKLASAAFGIRSS